MLEVNKPKKILIFGITGMLGYAIFDQLIKNKKKFESIGTYRITEKIKKINKKNLKYLYEINDLKDINSIKGLIYDFKPEFVINCIGHIKQKENTDKSEIIYINSYLPHIIHKISKKINAKYIHFSTDCVFSGNKGFYNESSLPDPLDLYGQSKLLGETEFDQSLVLRTSIIGHEISTSFSLLDWFLNSNNKLEEGFVNAYFSGLPVTEVAKVLIENIIPNFNFGLYHLGGKKISKYNLLNMIKKIYNLDIKIKKNYNVIIDRSLNTKLFNKDFSYRYKDWNKLLLELREYHEKNRKTFQK